MIAKKYVSYRDKLIEKQRKAYYRSKRIPDPIMKKKVEKNDRNNTT